MIVPLTDASATADRFEALLEAKGISVGANPSTGADMLPLWRILERLRKGMIDSAEELRGEYAAGIALHDMAAKVMAVENHPDFDMLTPHLRMLAAGAVHLTEQPPANADVYNKLIEVYWACLLMANGVSVDLDHPVRSTGDNPDVIALEDGRPARAYAFKTVRSEHAQSLLDHIEKGVDQIERSDAREGVVALHLTPRILRAGLWPTGRCHIDWRLPAARAVTLMNRWLSEVVGDNGPERIRAVFEGRKASSTVLCVALFPTVARNPLSGNAVVMPIKVATLVSLVPDQPLSAALHREIEAANDAMQTRLG